MEVKFVKLDDGSYLHGHIPETPIPTIFEVDNNLKLGETSELRIALSTTLCISFFIASSSSLLVSARMKYEMVTNILPNL